METEGVGGQYNSLVDKRKIKGVVSKMNLRYE
jgi:hypothetical protein